MRLLTRRPMLPLALAAFLIAHSVAAADSKRRNPFGIDAGGAVGLGNRDGTLRPGGEAMECFLRERVAPAPAPKKTPDAGA